MKKLVNAFYTCALLLLVGCGSPERDALDRFDRVMDRVEKAADDHGKAMENAHSTINSAARPVYGEWHLDEIRNSGLVIKPRLRIRDGVVTMIADCSRGGDLVRAEVSSPAMISEKEIVIRRAGTQTRTEGDVTCTANISEGRMSYEVAGDTLFVTAAGQTNTLRRVF